MTGLLGGAVGGAVLAAVVHAERLPGPTIESPEEGSPGFYGFLATFLLAAAVIALAVSFSRRMRRADHRARLRAQEEAARGDGPAPVTAEEGVAQAELDARAEGGRPSAPPVDGPGDAPGGDAGTGDDDPDGAGIGRTP
ncbi:hypothetical protein AB6N23_13820 [Cellulomonas sp. 179-A 9B4 NHS]|uniref:hypothetical protein n=1 Tax=Cellulomonas sp. 179-A 9B4 NHS TaxID=3142379 RepID=UPI0039A17DA7